MQSKKEVQIEKLANRIMWAILKKDKSGRLLYLLVKKLCAVSKLKAFDTCIDDKYKFVVITKDEYEKLKFDT